MDRGVDRIDHQHRGQAGGEHQRHRCQHPARPGEKQLGAHEGATADEHEGQHASLVEEGQEHGPAQGAQPHRGVESAVAPGIEAQLVLGEQRQQDAEVEPERRDPGEEDQRPQDERRAYRVRDPLPEAGQDARAHLGGRWLPERVGVDQQQAHERGGVAERVDAEVEADPGQVGAERRGPDGDRHAGHRRADDTRGVEGHRVEGDRVGQQVARHQLRGHRLTERHVGGVDDAQQEREEHHQRDAEESGGEEDDQCDDLHRGRDLGDHQGTTLVDTVGEHAAERRQHRRRSELEGRHDAKLERRSAQRQHEPGQRDLLHPRTGAADAVAEPVDAVVPDRQRAEAAVKGGAASAHPERRPQAPAAAGGWGSSASGSDARASAARAAWRAAL